MFLNCSTCFGRHTAHHQDLKNCYCSLWFYIRFWLPAAAMASHLVGFFYEIYVTMHGSMNIIHFFFVLSSCLAEYTVALSDFIQNRNGATDVIESSPKSVRWEPRCCMRKDRLTDGHDAAYSHFLQLLYERAETRCISLAPIVFYVFCVIRTNVDYFPKQH